MEKKAVKKVTTTVKSADRVLDIFELFAELQEPMTLMDISRRLDLPISSTYKILQNLLARGYLETDKHERMFYLGYKIFEIGTKYVQNTNLATEFQLVGERIVNDINEAVFISIRDGDKILYVAERQSSHPIRFVSHLGMKLPLHATAMGKVLLSFMDPKEVEKLYAKEDLGALTDSTICSFAELKEQLVHIREEGLAYSYGEAVQGVRCVAAPVYNSKDEVIASISISIPVSRLDDELWEKAKQCVRKGAKELSLKLYFKQS